MGSLPPLIKHDFASPVPDTGDANKVGSGRWNAALDVFLGTVCEALSKLDLAGDSLAYFDGVDSAKLTTLTSFARLVLAAETDAAARIVLGALGAGGDVMSGNLDMAGSRVTGLAAPANASDAARKADVDAVIAAVTGALILKGGFTASAGNFSAIATGAKTGWFWKIDVAGTVDGVSLSVGDDLFALIDNPSPSTYAGNWLKVEGSITAAEVIAALGYTPVTDARTISAAGLATGGGNLAANRTITVTAGTAADIATGTDTTRAVTPKAVADMGYISSAGVAATYVPKTVTVTGAGLATGGGGLSANQTITVTAAVAADITTGTNTTKAVTPKAVADMGYATSALVSATYLSITTAAATYAPLSMSISAAGLATGGGNLSANRTITVAEASQAQAEAGTASDVVMTPRRTAQAIAALSLAAGGAFANALLHVRDEAPSGTGRTVVVDAYGTVTLNTVLTNQISGASLSGNQITLPAGDYFVWSRAPIYQTQRARSKIYNVTDAVNLITGASAFCPCSTETASVDCICGGRFTLSATKIIELQRRCQSNNGGAQAGGIAASFGDTEVYAEVYIWKVG